MTQTVEAMVLERNQGQVVLGLPGTEYRLHVVVDGATAAALPAPGAGAGAGAGAGNPGAGAGAAVETGQRVRGRITVRAQRVDVVATGGRFIEPLFGRPRRVQGSIVAVDVAANTLAIHCAPHAVVIAKLTDPRQNAGQFQLGQVVGFDAQPGARFEMA